MALFRASIEKKRSAMPPVEVSVHGLGAGGFGVGALPDGKVVFLPRTAPGDRVLVRIVKEKARWARGEALEWIIKGPGRQDPPCSRYSECDGCSLQHLGYEQQLACKSRLVGDALRRLGGLDIADPEVVPSPSGLRYRNKMTFTLRRLPGGRIVAGLREMGHRGRVLDIGGECLLPEEPLIELWKELRGNWGTGASLLPHGRELRLTLRAGEQGGSLLLGGGKGDGDPDSLLSKVQGLSSVWRDTKNGPPRHLGGDLTLPVRWRNDLLVLHGGGFIQVNRGAGEELCDYVLTEAGDLQGKGVVDAYCGVGVLGRALALAGATVTGIDSDPAALMAVRANPLEGFQIIPGLVEEELGALLPADLLILNPPRSGVAESVPPMLIGTAPEKVLYVSCDPATLARDLKRLGERFQVERIRSFDLFPQTAHVETVVTLRVSSA